MRIITALPLLLALGLATRASAEFPLGNMGPETLGIQYGLGFRGQDITAADIPSHETIHAFTLGYSPIPYLGLEAGLGLDQFIVDRYNSIRFRGDYGISPIFGLVLASPYALDFIRVTGGIRALSLNSEDDAGFTYSGFVVNPWLSAVITPSAYFDFQLGARGHSIDGTMKGPSGIKQPFSNRETFRGFVSFTIKSPLEKAFLTLDLDFSPAAEADWSNGPKEASIGISCGTLLGWRTHSSETRTVPAAFPGYKDMKDKQDQMAEETK